MSSNAAKRYRGVKYQPVTSSLGEAAHHASGRVSSLRQRIPAYVIPLALCLIAVVGTLPFVWHGSSARSVAATQDDQVAIRLHPEDHVARQPKTLAFDFTISQGVRAIGGVDKHLYLVNDAFPGPTIEARSGDRIIVNVQNNLPDEGVSLHWHGLAMKDYNHMDGATGITQCPIASNRTFTYDFKIGDDEHGTFWWHSHVGVQRGDGLYGGLVVHEPSLRRAAREPEYLLLVGDWFHDTQKKALEWFNNVRGMGNEPVPESLVVNAHGRYNCSMAAPARPIVCSHVPLESSPPILRERKDAKLRIINIGTVAGVSMAVDGATLQATAVDGGWPIQAKASDLLGVVYPGQRVDVALKWDDNGKAGDGGWLSVYLDDENFGYHNPALEGQQTFAMLPSTRHGEVAPEPKPLDSYKDQDVLASTGSSSSLAQPLPAEADVTLVMYTKIQILAHMDNKPQGSINQTAWQPQSKPLLASAKKDWDQKQLVPFVPFDKSKPKHVDLVINNLDDGAHPFHFHGNLFYVLSSYGIGKDSGWGSYNPFEDEKPPNPLNHVDPVRRDTVVVPRHGHVVLRFVADSPGMWFFHCHMLVHMGTGMAGTLHVGDADDQDHARTLDQQAAQLCHA